MAGPTKTKYVKPIVLENEKSESIEKVENNLGAWGFFKYLYGKYILRLLALNLIMLVFVVPIYILSIVYSSRIASAALALPYGNSFGLGLAPWGGMEQYLTAIVNGFNTEKMLWTALAIPLLTIPVSGGFAVVRDSYWTGKLRIIKPFFKGVYETGLQILPFMVIIAGGFLGIHYFGLAAASMASWVAVLLYIVFYVILALFAVWALVFSGVVTLYRQSFALSIKSSLALTVRFSVGHIFTFILAAVPFVAMMINISFIYIIALTIVFMFGMIYVGLIWMIHMMKVCGGGAAAAN